MQADHEWASSAKKKLGTLQPSDTLLVTSLDKLARSTSEFFVITKKVEVAGASFRSLRKP